MSFKHLFFVQGASGGHAFYIDSSEVTFAFGKSDYTQTGILDSKTNESQEKPIRGFGRNFKAKSKPVEVFKRFKGRIKKICTGYTHTIVLTNDFQCFSIGHNLYGELGLGKRDSEINFLTLIEKLKHHRVIDIECGSYHSIFLLSNGNVFGCGWNVYGMLGTGDKKQTRIPLKMKFNKKVVKMKCGYQFTLLLTDRGELYKTGLIYRESTHSFVPILLSIKNESIVNFSAGDYHGLILTKSKNVYGIGRNKYTELLNDDSIPSVDVPTKNNFLSNNNVVDVKCGGCHSIVLFENGVAVGLGRKEYFGREGKRREVEGWNVIGNNISAIEVGCYCSFLIDNKGVLHCSGENGVGNLGIGNVDYVINRFEKNPFVKNIKVVLANHIGLPEYKKKIFDKISKEIYIDLKICLK